jgi:chorismate synthase
MNRFGERFTITTFGESHDKALIESIHKIILILDNKYKSI